ncbi:MAG: SUMF1/EgtB/PvdO family nonheme iron enzyme [Bacteroidaceae bacterium]|nr:SUMF1/EgtB/PvdO family nonheme iron enzyme [Bacteroidaceae bacterium]
MKKVLLVMIVMIYASSTYAQLELKSFKHDAADIDAVQYPKEDANHNICALVKVGLAEPGAVFEGDIIGKPDYKDGEYWVYLIEGSTWLNIKTKNYAPLRYDFPKPLNSKNVYIMLIMKPISDLPTGQINIRSNVKNAEIYIDDVKYSNVTPFVFKGTEGRHKIVLKATGYMDAERQVEVSLGKTTSIVINMDAAGALSMNGVTYGSVNVDACGFEMGSNRFYYEMPVHNVYLRPFAIGKRPVPVALWNKIMGTHHERNNGPNGEVVNITYNECLDFISLLNKEQSRYFRLPTEAEWEYCATHALELGIEEIGVTMEWCSDWFARYKPDDENNPTGPEKGFVKVVRGGSLYEKNSWYDAPTYRWHQSPEVPSERISFRLVEDR